MSLFNPKKLLVIDTECSGLRPWHGDMPFAFPLCDENGNKKYIEWDVDPISRIPIAKPDELEFLKEIMDSKIPKVFFNAKYDVRMMATFGIFVRGYIHDVSIAARISYTLELVNALKPLAWKYARYPMDDQKDLQKAVNHCRRIAKKELGWNIGSSPAMDYWLPRALHKAGYPVDPKACSRYALGDVERTLILHYMYKEIMENDPYLLNTYRMEMEELWPIVYKMEERGIRIHPEIAKAKQKEQGEILVRELAEIRRLVGDPKFNPNSHIQLKKKLFGPKSEGGLELPILKYTTSKKKRGAKVKTDNPSTEADILKKFVDTPLVRHILYFKSASHSKSQFFDKINELMVADINHYVYCIHHNLQQCDTATGRTSSRDPNLQNQQNADTSAKSFVAVQTRDCFGPRPGYVWIKIDWAQQEIRIFGECANIQSIYDAAISGRDINDDNTNLAWGGKDNPYALQAAAYALELGNTEIVERAEQIHKDKVLISNLWKELGWSRKHVEKYGASSDAAFTIADEWLSRFDYDIVKAEKSIGKKASRTRAKNCFYAKIYGGGAEAVMYMLYCPRDEAAEFLSQFDDIFPGINRYSRYLSNKTKRDGFVITKYGRKLSVDPDFAYRSVNYEVQGTAADMCKRSIIRCDSKIKEVGWDAHILLPVHDELIFEVKEGQDDLEFCRTMANIMRDTEGRLEIPMEVEVTRARTYWHEKEEVKI